MEGQSTLAFNDIRPENMRRADLNPHIQAYWTYGPPVIIGGEAQQYKDNWQNAFHRDAPLHLEVGAGNGFYLSGMSQKMPECNWLGIEIRYKRVIMCAKKIETSQLHHTRIMRYDAWHLDEVFGENTLDGLHTHHPDPWPKKRHAKKRLMGVGFAKWAAFALKSGAEWRIKTDFLPHIEAVLDVIATEKIPFVVRGRSMDLKNDPPPWGLENDIVTNYQSKFYIKDIPVYALWLQRL